jgi:diguanylate cyclase (GGDEF)-like protein
MLWLIDSGLIFAGIVLLAYSLFLSTRIITELETGTIKNRLILLRIMICVFIIGYIGYWVFLPHDPGIDSLIVSAVFFFAASFVIAVCWLMLQTVRHLKRVATLEKENITDPLLGIFNRRYLVQRLEEESARSQRYKLPLSILMLDIDHFKQINDKYGHASGDFVLSRIGQILQAQVRKSDLAARYGGDEIVLLLPNTEEKEAFTTAERIRQAIEQTAFKNITTRNDTIHCTVSAGVSAFKDTNSGTDLLHKVDIALYQAKQIGRNRVVIYQADDKKTVITN